MREWIARLWDWMRRDRLDAELTEELRFHRQMLERDALAQGLPADAAARTARRRLGNLTSVKEDARERWSIPWLDHLLHDIRYALRGLGRAPGFTAAVVITLGLGIGANAVMYGVIDRLMVRPFPHLRDPDSVDRVYLQTASRDRQLTQTVFPYTRYLDLARATTSFAQTAAFTSRRHGVGIGEAARERHVLGVSAGFFDFFDIRPARGRFFAAAEDSLPAGANVAVVSHAYWVAELGARAVLGEPIQVGNVPYTIVGVAPEGFDGVDEDDPPAVYVPITAYALNEGGDDGRSYWVQYKWDWTQMMVRRKPGVSRAAASADLSRAFVQSREAARAVHPLHERVERSSPRALAGPLKTAAGPDPGLESRTLVWVTGVSVIVLLIACANVANLMLARALRRRREVALRVALGVSRGRLAAQSLTESLVLALLGCLAGILLAQSGGAALGRLFLGGRSTLDVATDWRTLGVAAAAALVAAVVTATVPIFFVRIGDLTASLKAGAREGTFQRSRLRATLLVLQGALSVVLLVGAGLFVRSLGNVRDLPLGYDLDRLLVLQWEPRGTSLDSAGQVALRRRMVEAALAMPGVERAGWASHPVFNRGTSILSGIQVPGVDSVSRLGRFTFQTAGGDYFATMGTRILRGRALTEHDRAGAPRVTVVSEAMARTIWPDEEAVGRCMRLSFRGIRPDTMPCTTVVGVAENAVHDPASDQPLRYYLPQGQLDFGVTTLLVRVAGDPAAAAEPVRRALQRVVPGQSYLTAQAARALFDGRRRSWLVGATMFVALGVLALVVAAVGLYGVIAYTVAQRMHELGVRIALGARALDVIRLVVGQGVRFAVAGSALGCVLALALARCIQPLLFRQSATDPLVLSSVGALLVAVAILASAAPAVRAMRADPNTVLRVE